MKLAQRMNCIQPSLTIQVSMKAKRMQAQGIDVVSLSAGEPDFTTPDTICQAAKTAIDSGHTHYTAVHGSLALRQAIATKFNRDNGIHYDPENIVVSSGAKQSIFNALATILNPKDEVIIPVPYWVSYPEMVKMNDGIPVLCQAASGRKPLADDLAKVITPKTKLLMLNSPNNPGGYTYKRDELEAIGALLRQHPHVYVLSDDIYEYLNWSEQPFCNLIMACPDLQDRTVMIHGVSKGYAMTGWRIGIAAAHPDWVKAMKTYQSQTTSCANAIAQMAAIEAMHTPKPQLQSMFDMYQKRHQVLLSGLQALPGVSCAPSEGAFYAFPNFQPLIEEKGFKDDIELADQLLTQAHVAVVPGSGFGCPNHLRLSFATSEEALQKALERMAQFIASTTSV